MVLGSSRNARLSILSRNSTARRAALSMSCRVALARDIDRLRRCQDRLATNPVRTLFNRPSTDQVYPPSEHGG